MASLKKYLKKKDFVSISMKMTKTQHFKVTAKVNNVKGKFIVDTGASTTCIGFDDVMFFGLETEDSDTKAAGAGAVNMETLQTTVKTFKIGNYKINDLSLIAFNMSHVNEALENHGSKPVNGIIGADILKKAGAIIDYKKGILYLK